DLAAAQSEHAVRLGHRPDHAGYALRADRVNVGTRRSNGRRRACPIEEDRMSNDSTALDVARPLDDTSPEDNVTPDLSRELESQPAWLPRAGRRNSREKFAAGLRGLKHAIRGDSSFFAHAYRGTLIAITAAMLSVDPLGWCLLVIAASM